MEDVTKAHSDEEIEEIEARNPITRKIKSLEQENALLYSAIAELSILLGGGSS